MNKVIQIEKSSSQADKAVEELLAQLSLLWEAGLTMGEVSAFTEMTRPRCQRARKTDCGRTEGVN
jgi:hypothetical protein